MILTFFLFVILSFFSLIFSPFDTVDTLPWGIDEFLISGISGFNYLIDVFPPFATILSAFIIFMGWRLGNIILRFFLGSRTPTQ